MVITLYVFFKFLNAELWRCLPISWNIRIIEFLLHIIFYKALASFLFSGQKSYTF